jgi:porin
MMLFSGRLLCSRLAMKLVIKTVGLLSLLALSQPAIAAEPVTPTPAPNGLMAFLTRDYLLGDWGGHRSALAKKGVEFEFFYYGALPWNVSGGLARGNEFQGVMAMMMDLDTEKLLGFHGGHFHAGSLYIHGRRFSPNHVGDLNQVSLIDFAHGFRLWELWYEQKFLADKFSLKLGQMAIDQDFLVPEYSKTFLNQTFYYPTLAFNVYDIPGLPPGSHSLSSTPFGGPGARLRYDPIPQVYVQAGVYDGFPDQGYTGTRVNLNDNEGALAYFETGYRLNQGKDDTGLPGSYKVGAYFHTDDFLDLYDTIGGAFGFTAGTRAPHGGNYGVYLLGEQLLYREGAKDDPAGQGLGTFFRAAVAPSDRNLAQLGLDAGLVYKGLIPSRDYDSFGIAFSYLEMSADLRRAQRDANAVAPGFFVESDYESVLELTYKAQVTAWWTLQTSLERVFHPGGSRAIPNAWVVVLQTTLRF